MGVLLCVFIPAFLRTNDSYIDVYIYIYIWGFPKINGTLFGSPHNKDYSILGSILGSHYFGKLPYIHILYVLGKSRA